MARGDAAIQELRGALRSLDCFPPPKARGVAMATAATFASTLLLDLDDHTEVGGLCLSVRNVEAFRRQSPAQQFANRRRPARHMTTEPPLIESAKLL